MNPEQYRKIGQLFDAVQELAPNARAAFLAQACGNDEELRAGVEQMLANYEESQAEGFLNVAAWDVKDTNMIGQELNGYIVREKLEAGGMSEVYQVEDITLGRPAILKIVGTHLEPEDWKRFDTERRTLAKLDHPNIAEIYAGGALPSDGRPYMIMELVEGKNLRHWLTETLPDGRIVNKSLPPAQVVAIAHQACAGLHAAHEAKVIHRDLKPENIIVGEKGGRLQVKLIDFGIAVPQESTNVLTRRATQGIIGTPAYMSPEQADGATRNELKPASDIYSMGVVLFEMLTGERPFAGHGAAVAIKHIAAQPPSVRQVRPDLKLPAAVDRVLLRMLSKDPLDRPATATQLAADLAQALESKKRGKWITAGAGVLAIALSAPWLKEQISTPQAVAQASPTPSVQISPPPTAAPTISPSVLPSASPTASPTATASTTTGIAVSILRLVGKETVRVSPDFPFRAGDQVRIANTPPQDGVLYILQRGSSGKVSILFPHPQINGGRYQVKGGQEIIIPGQHDFKFDRQPGTETLYVLFAPQRGEAILQELETVIAQKKTALNGIAATTLLDRLEQQAKTMQVRTNSEQTQKTFAGAGALVGVLQLRHEQ